MLPFDGETILAGARDRGVHAGYFEKAVRLLHILNSVGQDPFLKDKLSLRGGTAINLFYLPGPRLSVDADFSFIGAEDAAEMRAIRPQVETRLTEIAEAEGYSIEVVRNSYALGALHLRYTSAHNAPDFVKLEINYLMRVPLAPIVQGQQAVELLPGLGCSIKLVGKDEVYAGKLKATIQRTAERDLFDVDRLLGIGALGDLSKIRYLTTFFLATDMPDAKMLRAETLAWPTVPAYMSAIHPMIRGADRRPLPSIRAAVEPVLRGILTWDARQMAFLDAVAARQSAGAALFPGDAGMAERINRHPAMKWRYENPRAASAE
jgi:hypothetical protein